MSSFFYPDLDPKTIKNLLVIRQLIQEHEEYFEESPYPVQVEEDLKKLLQPSTRSTHTQNPAVHDDFDLMQEIKTTYQELNLHRPSTQEDAAMMAYYRTRASLLEKMLGQLEQAKSQKMVSDFFGIVISILEEVTSPTQQAEFIERLKEYK